MVVREFAPLTGRAFPEFEMAARAEEGLLGWNDQFHRALAVLACLCSALIFGRFERLTLRDVFVLPFLLCFLSRSFFILFNVLFS